MLFTEKIHVFHKSTRFLVHYLLFASKNPAKMLVLLLKIVYNVMYACSCIKIEGIQACGKII